MALGWYLITVGIPLICFLYWVFYRPTSLWTGFLLTVLLSTIYLTIIIRVEMHNATWAFYVALPAIFILFFVGLFGLLTGVIALFWNERILLKRERFSLSNLLPLIVAVGLVLFQILIVVASFYTKSQVLGLISGFVTVAFGYTIALFFFYFVTSVIYNHFPLYWKVDYIIILGAGLIDGERVTPLLAGRVDAGVKLYQKQLAKKNHQPTIILSGGQGPDEKISEAQAMFNYIEEQGYELGTVYLEEKSTNTKENLQFSEKIIYQQDKVKHLNKKNLVIATSDYHLLRAGKLGNRLGIFVRGVGSKTKAYYLPTAFIREYIGYLAMTKKRHILFFSTLLVLTLLFGLFEIFFLQ